MQIDTTNSAGTNSRDIKDRMSAIGSLIKGMMYKFRDIKPGTDKVSERSRVLYVSTNKTIPQKDQVLQHTHLQDLNEYFTSKMCNYCFIRFNIVVLSTQDTNGSIVCKPIIQAKILKSFNLNSSNKRQTVASYCLKVFKQIFKVQGDLSYTQTIDEQFINTSFLAYAVQTNAFVDRDLDRSIAALEELRTLALSDTANFYTKKKSGDSKWVSYYYSPNYDDDDDAPVDTLQPSVKYDKLVNVCREFEKTIIPEAINYTKDAFIMSLPELFPVDQTYEQMVNEWDEAYLLTKFLEIFTSYTTNQVVSRYDPSVTIPFYLKNKATNDAIAKFQDVITDIKIQQRRKENLSISVHPCPLLHMLKMYAQYRVTSKPVSVLPLCMIEPWTMLNGILFWNKFLALTMRRANPAYTTTLRSNYLQCILMVNQSGVGKTAIMNMVRYLFGYGSIKFHNNDVGFQNASQATKTGFVHDETSLDAWKSPVFKELCDVCTQVRAQRKNHDDFEFSFGCNLIASTNFNPLLFWKYSNHSIRRVSDVTPALRRFYVVWFDTQFETLQPHDHAWLNDFTQIELNWAYLFAYMAIYKAMGGNLFMDPSFPVWETTYGRLFMEEFTIYYEAFKSNRFYYFLKKYRRVIAADVFEEHNTLNCIETRQKLFEQDFREYRTQKYCDRNRQTAANVYNSYIRIYIDFLTHYDERIVQGQDAWKALQERCYAGDLDPESPVSVQLFVLYTNAFDFLFHKYIGDNIGHGPIMNTYASIGDTTDDEEFDFDNMSFGLEQRTGSDSLDNLMLQTQSQVVEQDQDMDEEDDSDYVIAEAGEDEQVEEKFD